MFPRPLARLVIEYLGHVIKQARQQHPVRGRSVFDHEIDKQVALRAIVTAKQRHQYAVRFNVPLIPPHKCRWTHSAAPSSKPRDRRTWTSVVPGTLAGALQTA